MAEHAKALLPRHAAGGRPARSAATALAAPAGTPAARSWHPCARCRARARRDARRTDCARRRAPRRCPHRDRWRRAAPRPRRPVSNRARAPRSMPRRHPAGARRPARSSRPISASVSPRTRLTPQPVQLAFAQRRVTRIELGRDAEVEHRVAEELEAFVVAGAEARVRQRQFEQVAAREVVPDTGLQARQVGAGVTRHRE